MPFVGGLLSQHRRALPVLESASNNGDVAVMGTCSLKCWIGVACRVKECLSKRPWTSFDKPLMQIRVIVQPPEQ